MLCISHATAIYACTRAGKARESMGVRLAGLGPDTGLVRFMGYRDFCRQKVKG